VLIQKAEGDYYHRYFFPAVAGVGYSRNPFRWNPKIRKEEGFLRLVSGFGTRAVERVANDYPRIVALSHPQLRPYVGARETRKYSQHYIDVLDVEANARATLPVREVLSDDYPALRYIASLDKGDYLSPIISRVDADDTRALILTFEQLTKDRNFVTLMRTILKKLECALEWPVDIEFTVDIHPKYPHADYTVHLLQCRPLVSQKQVKSVEIPDSIPESDVILRAAKLVPNGVVTGIRYIVYVDPVLYNQAPNYETKFDIARVIGRLNKRLEKESFILVGPGRWGSSDVDLGVKVTYADIFNTKVLVEVPLFRAGSTAEPSYGTHFFQDLIETGIFPLPIAPGPGAMLNTAFLTNTPNALPTLLPDNTAYAPYIHVTDVPAVTQGRYLDIVMNEEQEKAIGYLK
jgi:hypothetical protein